MNLGHETEQIEFKKSTGELKEGIISLTSMLNKHGSCDLYFGVKNDGDVIGQQIGDSTLRDISQSIATNVRPQIIPTISYLPAGEHDVIRVQATGSERPYSAYGRYYMRSADEDREIAPAQLRQLMLSGLGQSITSIKSENQLLTFQQLQSLYITKNMTVNPQTFARNAGLLMADGSYNLMAELLADSNPYSIKVARFEGKDKTKLITRNEYGYKCLVLAMRQALDYVESINETRVEFGGGLERKETSLFDFSCFREAWVNACLHNRWSSRVSPAVYIFDDRVEIVSTGGLPADYSPEEFFAGVSHPINIGLQKILGQLDIVEQTGHGVPLIVNQYGKEAFTITEHSITVTLPFAFQKQAKIRSTSLSKPQTLLYQAIADHPEATISELAKATGLSASRISQLIRALKAEGKLQREGSNRSGRWVLLQ